MGRDTSIHHHSSVSTSQLLAQAHNSQAHNCKRREKKKSKKKKNFESNGEHLLSTNYFSYFRVPFKELQNKSLYCVVDENHYTTSSKFNRKHLANPKSVLLQNSFLDVAQRPSFWTFELRVNWRVPRGQFDNITVGTSEIFHWQVSPVQKVSHHKGRQKDLWGQWKMEKNGEFRLHAICFKTIGFCKRSTLDNRNNSGEQRIFFNLKERI